MTIVVKNTDDDDKHITHLLNYLSDNDLTIIEAIGIVSIVLDELQEQRKDEI